MNRPIILLIMNRNRIFYLVALIVFITVIVIFPSKAIQSVISIIKIRPLDNKTIVIDPGYGGIDGEHQNEIVEEVTKGIIDYFKDADK